MKILLTGVCGFAGSTIASALLEARANLDIVGVDNFSRAGSELNRARLRKLGVDVYHADIRLSSDIDTIGPVDWVIDAAANPSVLAGIGKDESSRQVIEHNLIGTINLLEYCKRHRAGIILLSTSRVYSMAALKKLRLSVKNDAFVPGAQKVRGFSNRGVIEGFPTDPPLSLYGTAKLASEHLIAEYSSYFQFPAFINRCGVLAGTWQFGKADQGIFSFWIHSFRMRKPLSYIGFGGKGYQVRDCFHPRDLVPVLLKQMKGGSGPLVCNFSGGMKNSMSLRQLTDWCSRRFGKQAVREVKQERAFDVPWLVLDSTLAKKAWNWQPRTSLYAILEEVAGFAESNPGWLNVTS
jgi:CDP-paratose 2-epimerase